MQLRRRAVFPENRLRNDQTSRPSVVRQTIPCHTPVVFNDGHSETNMKLTLIGYRGCGKSSVGPLLAETLGLTCIDSDDHVEDAAGKSIQQIFADDGEAEFRRLESQVIADLLAQDDIVVAAGGGAILAETNRKCMQDAGSVIWLQATVETLASRIAGDETSTSRRPSLTGKSIQEEIAEVLEARRELYQKASTMTVDTDNRAPQEIADEIVTRLAGVSE